MMKTKNYFLIAFVSSMVLIVEAEARLLVHFDFDTPKNTVETWEYEDLSGNDYHGNEVGSFYNYNGDPNEYADMQAFLGGARGGVYAYRWTLETDYDASLLSNPQIDGQWLQGSGCGAWDNNRVNLITGPQIAANAGLTLMLWVYPETNHVTWRDETTPNPDFCHLVALGAYGNTPIASLELDASKHVHGWIEGDGSDTQYEITGTDIIDPCTWTHIAITYDRVNNAAKTYINGILDSTTAISGVGDGALNFSYGTIGGGFLYYPHRETFLGMLDDVRIYDEVLTQQQIYDIFNASTVTAGSPDPYDGEKDVIVDVIFGWKAPMAYTPTGYNFYLDPNEMVVQNATPASTDLFHKALNLPDNSYDPELNLDCNVPYFWRLDAIEEYVTIHPGSVWKFSTQVCNSLQGDINKDGEVNLLDKIILFEQWLYTGPGWPADVDKNLTVDLFDYAAVSSQWKHCFVEDVFYDNRSMDNWFIVDEGTIEAPSNWNIVQHAMAESSNIYGPDVPATDNRKGTFAYWSDPKSLLWENYQFDVSLVSTDNDGIGVIFRYLDANNYYKLDMDQQRTFRKIFKMHNGVESTLAEVSQGYTVGQPMRLSVNVQGNQFNVLLDGTNIFGSAVIDPNYSNPCGTVALYNWGNESTYFDDFQVHVTKVKAVLAVDDSYSAHKDMLLEVTTEGVLANDIAAEGSLTVNLVTPPSHGDLTLLPDGTFTYMPDPNYAGQDSFVYEAVTENQKTDKATVKINVYSDSAFSIVLLPDTQTYSTSYPHIFTSQTQWIVNNKDNLRIAFVLHEGDITNTNAVAQWNNANTSLSFLDGEIPYVLVPGNHDMGTGGTADTRDLTLFHQYFPVSRYDTLPHFGGIFETDHLENSYHYFTTGGIDWLVIALEFGPRKKVLDWANQLVADHPHRRVIVLTHNYLYTDDTLVGPGDTWNPHDYGLCSSVSDPNEVCNDGEEMWTNFVKLHENISFVFCGHILNDGTGKLVSTGDNGNQVYQMLANYQTTDPNGGNGFLRIVTFYPSMQMVEVKTYSPYVDLYKTEPDQQFEFLNVDLTTP